MARNVADRLKRTVRRLWPRLSPSSIAEAPAGIPREATEVETNLGPAFDAAVARVRDRMVPAGVDPEYDLAYEHFDLPHFLIQARHVIESDSIDPLKVFLRNGANALASPEINFNMEAYLSRHPERAKARRSPYVDWLVEGRAAGEVADPASGLESVAPVLGLDVAELVEILGRTRLDLQDRLRTGTLGRMITSAAEIEPLIGQAWVQTPAPVIPPFASTVSGRQVSAIHACQRAAGFRPARLLLVVTKPRWGGGRRLEGHLAHALVPGHLKAEEIVVVYTDGGGTAPPTRFPPGVREVDLATEIEGMDAAAAHRVVVELVRSFDAETVVNVNSTLLYGAMATYGRALAATERMFLVMFGNEQMPMGNWVGIPLRYFYRCFDMVDGVVTDSEYLADHLRERHQLGPDAGGDRIHVFRAPAPRDIPLVAAPRSESTLGRRPQVFWAGRWDPQKRVDLAIEIARRMPDVQFRFWGEAVLTNAHARTVPPNITTQGPYDRFEDLPLTEADVWLYTSGWDGVPSQLLEVAMTGIPIVGSLVGGTAEVLDEDGAWPVADYADPEAYVSALNEVLADPQAARTRAIGLRERLVHERTEEAYARHASSVLFGCAASADGPR